MKTYAIMCLGCKVNTYEAQSISDSLKQKGLVEVSPKEFADVYCIFTCAVTNAAESKSRKKINQAIRQNPKAIICVVGCLVQIKVDELNQNSGIDILVGSSGKDKIVDLILNYEKDEVKINHVANVRDNIEFDNLKIESFNHQTRAFLKVQDGCNQFCSYCIIPYARGKERSLNPDEVIKSAKILAVNHHEIVLAGIHTGRYGAEYNVSLAKLIEMILAECKDLKRIRISSIEISEITDELLMLMKNNPRIAKHLHIPLQSGNNKTLKDMNRPYTTEMFTNRINEIRAVIKDISISTDLIVGFPNESDNDFESTCDYLKAINFSFIHCFPYSVKTNTVAEKMSNHVSELDKKKRAKIVGEISQQLNYCYQTSFISKDVEVIIESCHDNQSFGHSSEYLPITLNQVYKQNQIVEVNCTHYINDKLFAKEK